MVFKCKICGGQVQVDRAAGICICEYCGTKQTLPQFADDSSKRLFDSGNNYLQHSEYDKAEHVFNQLLSLNPQDAEIYWDLVLCKYGVTYVKDPKTQKYIPTCNRTHYTPIFSDENYKKAVELSSGEKKALFETDAKTIDSIQRGIISVSKKEKPFDIFISYKETDRDGNRTKDSVVAQELYEKLVASGYKVFFSRITLENKIGTEYEPYIYAALSSSKVMLTVSSSKENIEAPWVKNEWSRFLTLRQADASKTLIPLYFDMSKSALPEEFAILSMQDMTKEGFEQELIRGIKKMIPLPVMLAAKRKKRRKQARIISITAASVILVVGVAAIPFMKDYVKNISEYNNAMSLYDDGNYDKAKEAFTLLDDFKNSNEMVKTCDYDMAMQLYYDSNYPQAAWAFRDLNGYKDSAEMQKKSELAWREKLSTVAINQVGCFNSGGAYYITPNGTVNYFNNYKGSANQEINLNGHGKIISISSGENLYALHEDGFVTNSAKNNQLEEDWTDIVQISPFLDSTSVALKNDGTILYGNNESSDRWLAQTQEWNNIVEISWGIARETVILVGLDADGRVCSACNCYSNIDVVLADSVLDRLDNTMRFLSSLTDIRSISIYMDSDYRTAIVAKDKSNNLITYLNGETETISDIEVEKFKPNYYSMQDYKNQTVFYYTDRKKNLYMYGSDKVIIEDVVWFNEDFLITQSGSIYCGYNIENQNPVLTEAKAEIKATWIKGE